MALTKVGYGAIPTGSVLQVQYTTITTTINTTNGSLEASGHIVAITPKFTDSKILIQLTGGEQTYSGSSGLTVGVVHYYRQLTGGSYADLSGQVSELALGGGDGSGYGHVHSSEFVDTSHNTTSAINYQTYIKTSANTYYYNYASSNVTLKVTEIKA